MKRKPEDKPVREHKDQENGACKGAILRIRR